MKANRSFARVGAVFAVWTALTLGATAATVNFLATEDNDLANAANWSASTWTSADTLVVSTDNFTMPADGLRISADLPASAELKFGTMPNKHVTVDFGGHILNTTTLRIGHMHDDNNRNYYIKAVGGFSGVTALNIDKMRGHIRFYDGVYRIKNKIYLYNWHPFLYVCSGAEVIVEDIVNDHGIDMSNLAHNSQFVLDGGKFTVLNHQLTDYNWRRVYWSGGDSTPNVKFLNGSVYDDRALWPSTTFRTAALLIKDSAYYATNATDYAGHDPRNTEFILSSKKEITNSVFRTAQIFCSSSATLGNTVLDEKLNKATVDFCDSEVTLAFAPSASSLQASRAGMSVEGGELNTIRIRGAKNRFTTQQFVLGGTSNTVEISGGTFDVSNKFTVVASTRPKVTVSDTTAYLKALSIDKGATDSSIAFAQGAKVTGAGTYNIGGVGGSMTVAPGVSLNIGQHYLRLAADRNTFAAEGATVTGSVVFAANDGRAVLGAGTYLKTALGPGWDRLDPLFFAEGMTNNVLVISNATYDCGSYFMRTYITTVDGPKQDGVPFTNCPNCRIELCGETPKFVVSSARISERNGQPWYGLALGEMIDHAKNCWTTNSYRLKDPLRVRYVLPPAGYAEAPVQCLDSTVVLGGNAEFEFDASQYAWPEKKTEIPLVYSSQNFQGADWRTYINVEQLNLTNAERLPSTPAGKKTYFKWSKATKTLNLVVRGNGGMLVIAR